MGCIHDFYVEAGIANMYHYAMKWGHYNRNALVCFSNNEHKRFLASVDTALPRLKPSCVICLYSHRLSVTTH
jgi:hypothetical protein